MRCRHCRKEIENGSIWCPYCGADQNSEHSIFGIFVLMLVFAAFVIYLCYEYKESKRTSKEVTSRDVEKVIEKQKFDTSDVWYKIEEENKTENSYEIKGLLLNKKNQTINNVSVYFKCYDEKNHSLGILEDNTPSIKTNEIWTFEVKYNGKVDKCIYLGISAEI